MSTRRLLAVDSAGGLGFGLLVLVLLPWLPEWERLPRELILFTMGANLAYGAYSGSLALRDSRSPRALGFLVGANAAWALLCLVGAAIFWGEATWLGRAHLAGEGLVVGALAWVERRVFFR